MTKIGTKLWVLKFKTISIYKIHQSLPLHINKTEQRNRLYAHRNITNIPAYVTAQLQSPSPGSVQSADSTFEYALRDHLGNTVVSFADQDDNGKIDPFEVLQRNHYYSFGEQGRKAIRNGFSTPRNGDSTDGKIGAYRSLNTSEVRECASAAEIKGDWDHTTNPVINNYLYNGKELHTWGSNSGGRLNWQDYWARWYSPEMGRWNSVEPLARKYAHISPYAYCANMPIIATDPDGMDIIIGHRNENGKITSRVIYREGKLFNMDGKTAYTGNNSFILNTKNSIDKIKSSDIYARNVLTVLEYSPRKHEVYNLLSTDKIAIPNHDDSAVYPDMTTIHIDPNKPAKEGSIMYLDTEITGNKRISTTAHEFMHSYQHDQGTISNETIGGIENNEIEAVNFQNRVNPSLGLPQMTEYGGKKIPKSKLENPNNPKHINKFRGR